MSRPPESVIAYVALGSNLGNRDGNIADALRALAQTPGVTITRVSTLLANPPVGMPPGAPMFLNGVAEVSTTLAPRALLTRLLEVEQSQGRRRRGRTEPRPIDLDLLLYGDEIIDEPGLTVPHPRLHQRLFVLRPLAEIAPQLFHPVLHATAADLLARIGYPTAP